MKHLEKYINDGLTIQPNTNGYTVFTESTQHFRIDILDELTSERFELEVQKQKEWEN